MQFISKRLSYGVWLMNGDNKNINKLNVLNFIISFLLFSIRLHINFVKTENKIDTKYVTPFLQYNNTLEI